MSPSTHAHVLNAHGEHLRPLSTCKAEAMEANMWTFHRHALVVAAPRTVRRRARERVPPRSVRVASKQGEKQIQGRGPGEEVSVAVTQYRDNWFDRLAIRLLSESLQASSGIRNDKKGYESLVEAASMVARTFAPNKQQEIVMGSLSRSIPSFIISWIRVTMPQSKFTRECFAFFTRVLFSWLIGPCEVRESEFQGAMEKNTVYIKKCRFLEASNCVGMCTNLCKMPSQKFVKDSLGMPLYMVPNFEDMSCEMIFGKDPPEPDDDPALNQPCYTILCKAKQSHNMNCSTKEMK